MRLLRVAVLFALRLDRARHGKSLPSNTTTAMRTSSPLSVPVRTSSRPLIAASSARCASSPSSRTSARHTRDAFGSALWQLRIDRVADGTRV